MLKNDGTLEEKSNYLISSHKRDGSKHVIVIPEKILCGIAATALAV